MSEASINHSSKNYIAIVEDDGSLGRSLARLLQASGYQPVTYHCAEAFLGDAKQPVFDCLIVDIQLDGMSGIELGERLTRDGSNIPLIFLTAHENRETLKQSIRTPYVALLNKTDSGETVIDAIESSMINTGHYGRSTAGHCKHCRS
jgi:FixJ family two-component response regulator